MNGDDHSPGLAPQRLDFDVDSEDDEVSSAAASTPPGPPRPQPLARSCSRPRARCLLSSPVTAPRPRRPPRPLFVEPGAPDRRQSAPVTGGLLDGTPMFGSRRRRRAGDCLEEGRTVRRSRLANINPFTPAPLNISSSLKRERREREQIGEGSEERLWWQVKMAAGIR